MQIFTWQWKTMRSAPIYGNCLKSLTKGKIGPVASFKNYFLKHEHYLRIISCQADTTSCNSELTWGISEPFLSKVQWLQQQDSQALHRWGSLLRGALIVPWVQGWALQPKQNSIYASLNWVLQSWYKIRGHTQSHARWLVRCLWLSGDKIKWQLQHKGGFAFSLEGH